MKYTRDNINLLNNFKPGYYRLPKVTRLYSKPIY